MLIYRQTCQQGCINRPGLGRQLALYLILGAFPVIRQMFQKRQIPGTGLILAGIQQNKDRFIHTKVLLFRKVPCQFVKHMYYTTASVKMQIVLVNSHTPAWT